MRPSLLLLLAACAPSPSPSDDPLPPPLGSLLVVNTPFEADAAASIWVLDADPGERVRLYGTTDGRADPGDCTPIGTGCIDLASPVRLGTEIASNARVAYFPVSVPRSLAGATVLLQAATLDGDTQVSEVLEATIGPGETDADGDGFTVGEGDCDDFDVTVFPGAPEACGEERDCDPTTPASFTTADLIAAGGVPGPLSAPVGDLTGGTSILSDIEIAMDAASVTYTYLPLTATSGTVVAAVDGTLSGGSATDPWTLTVPFFGDVGAWIDPTPLTWTASIDLESVTLTSGDPGIVATYVGYVFEPTRPFAWNVDSGLIDPSTFAPVFEPAIADAFEGLAGTWGPEIATALTGGLVDVCPPAP